MRRSWGGLERLLADMPIKDRAAIMAKLTVAVDELHRLSREAEAREASATVDGASDPAVVAAAAQVLRAAGWTVAPPETQQTR